MFTGFWAAKVFEILCTGPSTRLALLRLPTECDGWMFPWAAVYVAQHRLRHVRLERSSTAPAALGGLAAGGAVSFAAVFGAGSLSSLWRARAAFLGGRLGPRCSERYGEWALVTGASAGIGVEFARRWRGRGCRACSRRGAASGSRRSPTELRSRPGACRPASSPRTCPSGGAERRGRGRRRPSDRHPREQRRLRRGGPLRQARATRNSCATWWSSTAWLRWCSRVSCCRGCSSAAAGAVVITGSVAGRQPLPLHGVYSATKAFDLHSSASRSSSSCATRASMCWCSSPACHGDRVPGDRRRGAPPG